jgi:hypothetical protein
MPAAARIAYGRDVIDVDAETEAGGSGQRHGTSGQWKVRSYISDFDRKHGPIEAKVNPV